MYKLESESIDFVLAFPQAELEVDIYMEIPQGMEVEGANGPQVLKLINNLYALKEASYNWYTMIKKELEKVFCSILSRSLYVFEKKYDCCTLC